MTKVSQGVARLTSDNPLFTRLTRHAPGPSLRTCIGIAVLTFVLGAALIIAVFLAAPIYPTIIAIRALELSLTALAVMAALQAISLTLRDARGPAQDILRLTPLTRNQHIQGYTFGALYRVRAILAIAAGLTGPLFVLLLINSLPDGRAAHDVRLALLDRCAGEFSCLFLQDYFTYLRPAGVLAIFLLFGSGLALLSLIGVALGVRLALAWRSAQASGGVTVTALLILSIGMIVALRWADPHILDLGVFLEMRHFFSTIILLLPPGLAAGLLLLHRG